MTGDFPDLRRLLRPRGIAVVGASARDGSQGQRLIDNLVLHSTFDGQVFPVNPSTAEIRGLKCWPDVSSLPRDAVDVALVMVNASLVPDTLRQCVSVGIPFAIVMTSGFAEAGAEGERLQADIDALCAESGLRVYGPNCPGFTNVRDRIGMTFSPAFKDDLNPGPIGLATQGGGLGRTVLQALSHGPGVGLWFSGGNECDLGLPDFIAAMAVDPAIEVIAVLMEGIKDGARLIRALDLARANHKPVVLLKVGRSDYGVAAALSHTASVAGTAAVNNAVFRQHGAIQVGDLDELAAVSRLLAQGRPPAGTGICIVTISGGTAALAADLVGVAKLPLATFSQATATALTQVLPNFANAVNPLDTTADVFRSPKMLDDSIRIVCADPDVGAVLIPIPTDYGTITEAMAQAIVQASRESTRLILPVWMSRTHGAGFDVLERAGLQPFASLTDAVGSLRAVWPTDGRGSSPAPSALPHAEPRTSAGALSEVDAKRVLRQAGIAIPSGRLARSCDEALQVAADVGFPVVLKIVSEQILHKTEAGGVRLGIADADELRDAHRDLMRTVAQARPDAVLDGVLVERMLPPGGREVLVGVHHDAAFGPILSVGLGGIFVEVLRDVAHRALPITAVDASAMIRELRAYEWLEGTRGQPPADIAALERLLLDVSAFATSHADDLIELDLNPVWVGGRGQGAIALDALLVMKEKTST